MYGQSPPEPAQPGFPNVEQHHTLLPTGGRFPLVPTSAAHLAEQMESGGAKIEETLSRLNCKYSTLFFIASWGVVAASVFGIFRSCFHFQVANFVNSLFLLFFGLVTTILDIPGNPRWAYRYRQIVRKYVRLLTRLTGKSLWFFYLGSIIALSLWPTTETKKSGIMVVLTAFTVSFFVFIVAVIGFMISFRKSLRLERVRKILQAAYKGNSPEVYRKYAITDPSHGMQIEEFNRMCADHSQGKIQFDYGDLGIIYNALDDHQKSAINEREFSEWMAGPMTYL